MCLFSRWAMCFAALLAGIRLTIAGAADDEPAEKAGELRLVLLEGTAPRLLELEISVDGAAALADSSAAEKERFSRLLAWLDADGDGTVSLAEAERLPPPLLLLPAVRVGESADAVGFAAAAALCDGDGDGRISTAELAAYHRLIEGPAFGVQADVTPDAQSEGLSQLLIARLDADGDRVLSAAEIDAAAERLAALDQDDNQVVSLEEFGVAAEADAFEVPQTASPVRRAGMIAFRRGEEVRAARDIIARVNAVSGRTGRGSIRLAEAGWTEPRAAAADTDADGRLDAVELQAWLRGEPTGLLRVRLGDGSGETPLEFKSATDDKAESRLAGDVLSVRGGNGQLIVHKLNAGSGHPAETYDARLKAALLAADLDGDKRLSAEERANSALARAARFMDRSGDGLLDESELLRYAADVALPRQAALANRVTLILAPGRRGLFQLLDANQDGRLGLREIRAAGDVLRSADADADGQLKPDESPAVYRLAVARGGAAMFGKCEDQLPPEADGNEPFSYASPGPAWFRKMDRNRDGDVTPREFLGSIDRFNDLDIDRDGLLSGEETTRWRE